MPSQAFFRGVIEAIEGRGMGRQEIAGFLKITPSAVSQIKMGASLPADEKLDLLAELSGGKYTAREMLLAKAAMWLNARGIAPSEVAEFAEKQKN